MAMATEFIVISTVRETPFGGKNNIQNHFWWGNFLIGRGTETET